MKRKQDKFTSKGKSFKQIAVARYRDIIVLLV